MDAHEKALRETAASYAAAHEARDKAIRAAAKAGMTRRKIGELVGLSYTRVQQIVRAK